MGRISAGLSRPISVRLPADLLKSVDAAARGRGMTRTTFIIHALRVALEARS